MSNDFEEIVCRYAGKYFPQNEMCENCPSYLDSCVPIADKDGYALGSECGGFLCEGCPTRCEIGDIAELWG